MRSIVCFELALGYLFPARGHGSMGLWLGRRRFDDRGQDNRWIACTADRPAEESLYSTVVQNAQRFDAYMHSLTIATVSADGLLFLVLSCNWIGWSEVGGHA